MRNKLKTAALLLLSVAALPQHLSAQQTRILTADKHNEYGLVYSLPVTALEVTVTAKREIMKAGPYASYARKYLGTDKVITRDGERWTITDVEVKPYGVVDTETKYLMQFKPGATTYIGVADSGMLLSINCAPKQQAPAANLRPAAPAATFTGKEYLKYVNEDFTASQSSAKQAQMIAESLMEVRDAHLALTRGTAETMPVDGKQLELMLNSLQAQEDALTAAFTGTTTSEVVTQTFTYTPEGDDRTVLFRFSDFKGFTSADDYAGAPVNLTVTVTAEGELPVDADGKTKELPKDAVRYCIPGTGLATVESEGRKLWSKELDFSQFGVEFGLNPNIFSDKKQPSYAIFDPVTGALLEIGAAATE